MFRRTNKTADVLDHKNSFGHTTEYEIHFDKESVCLPRSRYEELIRAEVEKDIIVRASNAEPSFVVSAIVKAVATVREDDAENNITEAPKTPDGSNSEGGDA